ncbi:nitrilase-related carbon-nitrogen hydrolase [Patulibacter minatonensis]|uniref:nitrilase-related carbon-nitrogen hydrolase n=1 Tax=Patulibacter minatonensis TaxID=298163 RepID=UPI000478D773|nr:nitrilase-related carbon-nitrogen hydrolase [Patulibacter minatonensis]
MRAAVVQLLATSDVAAAQAVADRLVRRAAGAGARVVLLPEKWLVCGRDADVAAGAQPLDGPAVTWARRIAVELGIDLFAGSVAITRADGRQQNTALHAAPDGRLAVYGKLHLFDADVAGRRYRESDREIAGDGLVVSALADDAATGVGMTVCYDLRFPELHRALAVRGARIITVPAAFTERTTAAHWEVLLRARAIENGAFVLAANQHGEHAPGIRSGGRSMIVDPWGTVLAEAPDVDEAVVVADLDLGRVDEVREGLPVLRQRRADVAAALAAEESGDLAAAWPVAAPDEAVRSGEGR